MDERQAPNRDAAGHHDQAQGDAAPEDAGPEDTTQSRSANQVGNEPLPASHDDESRQAAVMRNEEFAADSAPREPGSSRDESGDRSQGR